MTLMPAKLKKAIGAVKDQTGIGLALVSKTATGSLSAHFDLLILRATTHDTLDFVDGKLLSDILNLTSSSYVAAAACVSAISRRIERTHNWVVALKSLHLIFYCLRDGGPHFPREAISNVHLLDLSTFCDESASSNQWDYSAFVRTYALYLQERLHCFLKGKMQNKRPRFPYILPQNPTRLPTSRLSNALHPPGVVINRIAHWQRLLDRAIATRPTGPAKTNHLVHLSFYLVVRESFDLYRDVAEGVVLLLDNFFRLKGDTCMRAYYTCVRAARQFEELDGFYDTCKMIGVGRRSEYPDVQMMSQELIETLNVILQSNNNKKEQQVVFIRRMATAATRAASGIELPSDGSDANTCNEDTKSKGGDEKKVVLPDLLVFDDDDNDNTDSDDDDDDHVRGDVEESATSSKGIVDWEVVLVESAGDGIENRRSTTYSTAFEAMEAVTGVIGHGRNNPFLENGNGCIFAPPPRKVLSEKDDVTMAHHAQVVDLAQQMWIQQRTRRIISTWNINLTS